MAFFFRGKGGRRLKDSPQLQTRLKVLVNFSINLGKEYSCTTSNAIYCISCDKATCKGMQYIGESGRQFKKSLNEHIGYVIRTDSYDLTKPTGAHFNLLGHSQLTQQVCGAEPRNKQKKIVLFMLFAFPLSKRF